MSKMKKNEFFSFELISHYAKYCLIENMVRSVIYNKFSNLLLGKNIIIKFGVTNETEQ
jgi:hypothetical protein